MKMSRRAFLGTGAALVAGAWLKQSAFGANDRVGVCCIGIHGQGKNHIRRFLEVPEAEIVALCDVDQNVLESRAAALEKVTGKKPKLYRDMREAFADDAIHAVSIATPNHWHRPRHLGLPGRQGCLRREAVRTQLLGRPAAREGREDMEPHRPARHLQQRSDPSVCAT